MRSASTLDFRHAESACRAGKVSRYLDLNTRIARRNPEGTLSNITQKEGKQGSSLSLQMECLRERYPRWFRFMDSALDQFLEKIPDMGYNRFSHDSTSSVDDWLVASSCFEHFDATLYLSSDNLPGRPHLKPAPTIVMR